MDPRMAARRRTVAESMARTRIRQLLMLVVVAGIGALVLAVLRSDLFSLDQITVVGAEVTDPRSVAVRAGAEPGTPLVALDLEAVTEALLDEPRIRTAEVRRVWPTGLDIVVTERAPVAWVDRGGGWEHTAVDGVVIERGDPDPVAPRIRSVTGLDRAVDAALEFVDALPGALATGMVVDARSEELAATWNGFAIRLGRPTDMAAKARALEAVIADEPPPGSEITLIAPERPAVLPPTTTLPEQPEGEDEGT